MRAKAIIYSVGLLVTIALLLVRYWDPGVVQSIRFAAFDQAQQLRPRAPEGPPVMIVDIDEASLAALGQWPWPRNLVAKLVERVAELGPAAIGITILFAEPDRSSPGTLALALPGIDEATRETLARLPDHDESLAASFAESRVILGQIPLWQPTELAPPAADWLVAMAIVGDNPRPALPTFFGLIQNLPILQDAAAGLGVLAYTRDSDDIVRSAPLLFRIGDAMFPAFALEVLRVATGATSVLVKSDGDGVQSINIGAIEIATESDASKRIHFDRGSAERFVSATDILAGRVPPERLAGRIVLLGTSAAGLFDFRDTPVEAAMPGVEVQAQLIETILDGANLHRPRNPLIADLVLVAVFCLLIMLLVPVGGIAWGFGVALALTAGMLLGAWGLFWKLDLLVDPFYPILAGLVLFSLLTYLNYVQAESQRRYIRSTFGKYISPDVVNQLIGNEGAIKLGGERREMSILFCELHGFTSISEALPPEEITKLINDFLTIMTDVVLEQRGTIDKYVGDSIMAFWNAPVEDPGHARHACSAALRMADSLVELDRRFTPGPSLNIGIGVNTGVCTVGNLGSEQRFSYSVLGDSVNVASRLAGQTRPYGVTIIIGEVTYEAAPDFAAIEIDLLRVKGKSRPVRIYALMGDAGVAETPSFQHLKELHGRALSAYRAQRWDEAEALIAECLDAEGAPAALYRIYEARIDHFRADPPGEEWDGVYVATSK